MKKLSIVSSILAVVLTMSSCSTNEETLDVQPEALIKNVSFERGENGEYSLDYDLNSGAAANVSNNENLNGKTLDVFADVSSSASSNREFLSNKESFRLGINNRESNSKSVITVHDNDIKFSRGGNDKDDHLQNYKVSVNEDGGFDLDFKVKKDITVDFQYNEDLGEYEIHLEPGTAGETKFSRTFEKKEGEDLVIAFVNHYTNSASRTGETSVIRKPIIVGENGEDN